MLMLTMVETWKQPKCPTTEEWIKMWHIHTHTHTHIYIHKHTHTYIYTMVYYSVIKKNDEIMSLAATRWT